MENHRFKLVKEEYIKEIKGKARFYVHEGCGAELVHLPNEDDNKVFAIGFKTYPEDDSGVAHILEHAVLSGSEKYPVKELFSTIMRRSLNTFINAMTFPDRTIYPVASRNSKDFMNLVMVYADSVFCPNIFKEELTFRQEGWSYAFDEEGTPYYNGIVYNEMKGAMASPEERAIMYTNRLLFDNTYSNNSGGEPTAITKLTYEQFLDFHRTFYHPSNARFYIYGDADAEAIKEFLEEEYLSKVDRMDVPGIEATVKAPASVTAAGESVVREWKPAYETRKYPAAEDFNVAMITAVLGDSFDRTRNGIASILTATLFTQDASPFKVAMLESGYCQDIDAYVETARDETSLAICLYGVEDDDPEAVERKVFEAIEKLDFGQLQKSFEATLADEIFHLKEGDTGNEPKGMLYMYPMELSRDEEDTFRGLRYGEKIAAVEEVVKSGKMKEKLLEYLVENPRRATVLLKADPDLSAAENEEKKKSALETWGALSPERQAKEREWAEKLIAKQESTDDPAELAKIPGLTLEDLKETHGFREPVELELSGRRFLYYEKDTSGIAYIKLYFPVDRGIDPALIGMTAEMLGSTDTENFGYEELSRKLLAEVGSMSFDVAALEGVTYLTLTSKMLSENIKKGLALVAEILTSSKVGDTKRMSEILGAVSYQQQQSIYNSGMTYARGRVNAGLDEDAAVTDRASGIGYYQALEKMVGKNGDIELLSEKLQAVFSSLIDGSQVILCLTSDEEGRNTFEKECPAFLETLPERKTEGFSGIGFDYLLLPEKEAFRIPSPVQYVALGGNIEGGRSVHRGAHFVASAIIRTYLWNEIRIKGGAYGSSGTISRDGQVLFGSYRDPNLKVTLDVFRSIGDYLAQIELADDELLEAKTSAIAGYEPALSARREGKLAITRYLVGVTAEEWNRKRKEILGTTVDDIRAVGEEIKEAIENGRICAIGNGTIIGEGADSFDEIDSL